ncbi:type II toxin-antitoxin system HipA family toxin [Achromobacter sp. GG226]|nr:type II toxin-antitoxin system HipA family toxin [Verticiella sp. GG226]
MNGTCVGTWSIHPSGDVLQYDETWVASDQGRPLSLSLPFLPGNKPHRGTVVRNYFENLLPDSKEIRERVARRFQAGSIDAFSLLAEIGRDCVGALQILPEATTPDNIRTIQGTRLTESDVAQLLRSTLKPAPLRGRDREDDDFRISIAGAQEKTALLHVEGQWCLPHGATPTTHILKLPLGQVGGMNADMSDSVENEWLCSEILRAYGLPVARTTPLRFEDMKVLAVERFDRRWWHDPNGERWLIRLPQEDICQATGTAPHLKYEADGGPGMRAILKLLATAQEPERDRSCFFQAQVLFWMLRAPDGHAKNFSIALRPGGAYALTPLYDVLSAYPVLGTGAGQISPFKVKMAMAMALRSKNAHYRMAAIQRRHWLTMGAEQGVVSPDGRGAEALIDDLVRRTPEVIQTVSALLPTEFPRAVAESIFEGLATAATALSDRVSS